MDSNFGGGVSAYRDFLIRTEGKADIMKYTLEKREQYFQQLQDSLVQSRYQPDEQEFLDAMFSRKFDPLRDRRLQWLLATAKLNQSERFGVGLGEAYGKDQDKFSTQPELLYVQLQEHYHTRILGDVVSMFGLRMPTIPPTFWMRQMVKSFVMIPHEKTLVFVAASEMVGCRLFSAMRDEGIRLFADEPEIATQIENLYNEIFADEIGHVGFLAAKLSPTGRAMARWLSQKVVWRVIAGSVPEIGFLFGNDFLKQRMHEPFDLRDYVRQFPTRAYAAASIL